MLGVYQYNVLFIEKLYILVQNMYQILSSILVVIMLMFNQTMYSVTEGAGPAQPVLILSGPSTMAITVNVTNTDGSAIGEYYLTISTIMVRLT